jgi:hypothetical protein
MAGTYNIDYTICEILNPMNCDTATVTVVVDPPVIAAMDDDLSASPVNGYTGATAIANALDNDTLNGVSVIPSEITLSPVTLGPLTVNDDGTVDVAAGTVAGTYMVDYTICEILNPMNCDTATVTVVVDPPVIDAVDNDLSASPVNGKDGAMGIVNVLDNDTLNGLPVNPAEVSLVPITTGVLTVNADGSVDVAADTPAGTYTVDYTICEILNPTNCDTATVTVVVDPAPIDAVDDDLSTTPVNGTTGATALANVLDNDTLNGDPVIPSEITLSPITMGPLTVNADGTLDVAAGFPPGTYTIDYTICENLNPTNCNTATATVIIDCLTFPMNDCDGDGVINSQEVLDGTDPSDPCDFVLASATVAPDMAWENADCDGDLISNSQEVLDGTDPLNPCSSIGGTPPVGVVCDADGDGVLDDQEILDGTDPSDPCDFVIASITEPQMGDYLVADCDGDGVTNGQEEIDGTNPEDPCDFDQASVTLAPSGDYLISDCDGDGVLNGTELSDGTDPADPCDFMEASITEEFSGDFLLADCDGDQINNGQEITDGTDPFDPCSALGGTPPAGTICEIQIDNDLVGPDVDPGFFRIIYIESYPNNTVEIYNRWGIKVYETTGYDNGSNVFTGISNGRATIKANEELPVGIYYYIINYENNGENRVKSGYLYINR